mmetsp:Transcript_128263/g.222367  ORF Transcript_128263/g.222367 Transcript_128263/m.222367 type:complete len:323 (-) Transcript_128263:440-1408(-)
MKVRASAIAFWARDAASSQALIASVASLEASTSMPFRKGISASDIFTRSSSAFSTFSTARARISATSSLSFCCEDDFTTAANFASACPARVLIPWSSSRRKPWALLSLMSMSFAVAFSFVCTDAAAFSMRSTSSAAGGSSGLRGTAWAATLSTSTSVACNLMTTSESICFTRTRSSASLVALLIFAISCCMLLTRVWSFPSSLPEPEPATANFFSSAVFCKRAFRAMTMLACAVRSELPACSKASLRLSGIASPALPMFFRARVVSLMRCISASAWPTLSSTSCNRCVLFLSARPLLNCCSLVRPSSSLFWSPARSSLTALA